MAAADAPAAVLAPIETPRSFLEAPRAAAVGDEHHLAAIMEGDAKALGAKDEMTGDPLTWAARNVRGGVVSLLLSKDADVESKSFGGLRPLHHAAQSTASEEIVRELLAKKADPNAQDDAGNTAFHFACRRCVLRSGVVRGAVARSSVHPAPPRPLPRARAGACSASARPCTKPRRTCRRRTLRA